MADLINVTCKCTVDPENIIGSIVEGNTFLDETFKNEKGVKIFRAEESVITLMKKDKKFKFMYNFCLATLLWLMVESALDDYYKHQRIYFMTRTLEIAFDKFHWGLIVWIIMQLVVTVFYYAFELWSSVRRSLRNNKVTTRCWDYTSLAMFISFQLIFLICGQCAVFMGEFGIGTGFVLGIENVRLAMKTHAFVRTNAPAVLNMETTKYNFRKYVYFLFAPTFLYRNSYPRTRNIRWRFVLVNFLEFFGCLFCVCYYYERHLKPTYHDLGKGPLSTYFLLKSFFFTTLSCSIIHIPLFYVMFQAWFNFFAEILQFADRRFYGKWWEADNLDSYFRNWNLVVQEWLHEFMYKDLKGKCSKYLIKYIIVFVSAFFHEVILIAVLQFFYPVLFILFFGCANIMIIVMPYFPKSIRGVIFWLFYNLGITIWLLAYFFEYRARMNCSSDGSLRSFFIPLSWRCIFS